MQVFYCRNLQGEGFEAVCSSLEKAKEWIKQSITAYQAETYVEDKDDPDPWEGWHWWEREGHHCFGIDGECAEAYVQEFTVI